MQCGELNTGIRLHGFDNFAGLKTRCFQGSTDNMRTVGKTRQADDYDTGIGTPARREQAGECRDNIDSAVVFRCDLFTGRGIWNDTQLVTQPLNK